MKLSQMCSSTCLTPTVWPAKAWLRLIFPRDERHCPPFRWERGHALHLDTTMAAAELADKQLTCQSATVMLFHMSNRLPKEARDDSERR